MAKSKKIVKSIKVDADKCNGCRACEIVCSAFHATPMYSSVNPARARVHVISQRLKNIWLPVFAGEYAPAECMGRNKYVIDGKEYDDCAFCRAACPSRDLFKEPDSGLPLKCDMCESDPPLSKPKCVEKCLIRPSGGMFKRFDDGTEQCGDIFLCDVLFFIEDKVA
ncbi:MAG: (4Fe-4S)-binding protein [Desulfomonile tiedjei]|uniref:(4Fe-4S)-binding protein n=1 Tax=Desulfomonile tiedjei TaxID=2358 RepID=A0A9D6V035_9BACT|nr:(4Fe-4S)-binding protein [Desulfomonile tiedjei]